MSSRYGRSTLQNRLRFLFAQRPATSTSPRIGRPPEVACHESLSAHTAVKAGLPNSNSPLLQLSLLLSHVTRLIARAVRMKGAHRERIVALGSALDTAAGASTLEGCETSSHQLAYRYQVLLPTYRCKACLSPKECMRFCSPSCPRCQWKGR